MKNFLQLSGLSALLVCGYPSQAQNRYEPATLVQASGDTLRGYLSSFYDSRQLIFRSQRQANDQKLTPATVQAFEVSGNRYVSRTVTFHAGGKLQTKTRFMQVLASGRVSLYAYTDRMQHVYYFVEKDGNINELRHYVPDALPNPDGTIPPTEDEFIVLLNTLTADAKDQQPVVSGTKFRRKNLISAVHQYNARINPVTARTVATKRQLHTVDVGIKFGENLSSVSLRDYEGQGSVRRGRLFGAFVNVPLEGINRNLSIRCEALLAQKNTLVGFSKERTLNYVDFVAMVRYSAPTGFLRPYMALGIVSGATAMRRASFLAYKPKNGAAGPMVEAGLQARRVFLGLRAESLMRDTQMFQRVFSVSTGVSF